MITLERIVANSKIQPSGCLEWQGSISNGGYGRFTIGWKQNKKNYAVHRECYRLTYGGIADGLHVCHTCDNRLCVNPDHMFLGTNADNMMDKVRKGRQSRTGPKKQVKPSKD